MKQRLLALVLGIVMIASLIVPAAIAEDEVKTIYWQWPTAGDVSDEALAGMEEQFNAMLVEAGIPAKVEFIPTGLFTCQQDATLMISTGEQLDIMLTAFTTIDTLVNSNQILPIEDLVDEYAPDAMAKSYSALKCTYEGHLYGITTGDVDYNQNGYMLKQSFIDKYNIEIDPDHIYTIDELEEIFNIIDEGEGGGIEFTTPWDDYEPGNRQYFMIGEPTGSLTSGCINFSDAGFDSTTIVNLIETDAYAEYAQRMYEWAQKGWIAADASVTTESPDDRVKHDNVAGEFCWGGPTAEGDFVAANGPAKLLKLTDYYRTSMGTAAIMWNIPATSIDPALALQVLNFIYANTDAATLIQRGREGIEWNATDVAEDGTILQIQFTNDDVSQLDYHQYYGIYGNTLDWPGVYPNTRAEVIAKAEADASVKPENIFVGAGYTFNGADFSAETAAVETVLAQYCKIVNCGAADPADVLPEFIEALKVAGIDTVIAANQEQLDDYMASK